MGTTLDLLGKYAEAQRHIRKMMELAPNPDAKTQAARAMVISYVFERKPAGSAKYEKQILDSHLAAHNFAAAAEVPMSWLAFTWNAATSIRPMTGIRKGTTPP